MAVGVSLSSVTTPSVKGVSELVTGPSVIPVQPRSLQVPKACPQNLKSVRYYSFKIVFEFIPSPSPRAATPVSFCRIHICSIVSPWYYHIIPSTFICDIIAKSIVVHQRHPRCWRSAGDGEVSNCRRGWGVPFHGAETPSNIFTLDINIFLILKKVFLSSISTSPCEGRYCN